MESKEWLFLIRVCTQFVSDGGCKRDLDGDVLEDLDWDVFYQLATNHRILTLVSSELEKSTVHIPDRIKAYCSARTRYNLTLSRELLLLIKIFKKHGFSIIPYKGIVLSHYVYGNIGARSCADIDIMIDQSQLDQIKEVLSRHDYLLPLPKAKILERAHRRNNCEISIMKRVNIRKLSIDTHWRIANRTLQMNVGSKEMLEESKSVDFFGDQINFLNPEALIITTVMHHFGKEKMVHLKQVIDLAMIIKKFNAQINWPKLATLSKQWKIFKLTMTALLLIRELLGTRFPAEVDKQVSEMGDLEMTNNIICELRKAEGKYADDLKDDFLRGLNLHLRTRDDLFTKFKVVFFHFLAIISPTELDFKNPQKVTWVQWIGALVTKPFRLVKDYVIS